jgi:HD-like signal output (HDOD) protein
MAKLIDRGRLERILRDADALPPCPAVLTKVGELSRDPTSSARDLGAVIATDEALAAQLIKRVNSAFYGLRGTISTVTQAVVILGYQEIRNIVYTVQTEQVFSGQTGSGGIDVLALWDHSLQVAVLARDFSYRIRYPIPEEVFVAGIIHDIGQVIMNSLLGEEYRRFKARAHADLLDLAAAEVANFGVDHTEVGWRLTAKWDFPESLQLAVRHHHRLESSEGSPAGIAPMVLAANIVCLGRERGRPSEELVAEIPESVRDLLRLDLVRMEESMGAAAEEYNRIRGSFDLTRSADDEEAEEES